MSRCRLVPTAAKASIYTISVFSCDFLVLLSCILQVRTTTPRKLSWNKLTLKEAHDDSFLTCTYRSTIYYAATSSRIQLKVPILISLNFFQKKKKDLKLLSSLAILLLAAKSGVSPFLLKAILQSWGLSTFGCHWLYKGWLTRWLNDVWSWLQLLLLRLTTYSHSCEDAS